MRFTMKSNHASMTPRKHIIGEEYIGCREGSSSNGLTGILVRCYVTVNGPYRNPAYILLCEDGKERSFQRIVKRF